MANQYSVEIHAYISEKIAHATGQLKKATAADDLTGRRFYEGQLYELETLHKFQKLQHNHHVF